MILPVVNMNVNFSEQVKTFENSTDDNQQEQQKFRHMKEKLLIGSYR